MKVVNHVPGRPEKKINQLIKLKADFLHIQTTYTDIITLAGEKHIYAESQNNIIDFVLIKQIKREVEKNLNKIPVIFNSPKYWVYDERLSQIKKGEVIRFIQKEEMNKKIITEIDLSGAYVYAFFNTGLISEELKNKILSLPKYRRLKILGSIAVKKNIVEYSQGKKINIKLSQSSEALRKAWFYVCSKIDLLMIEIKSLCGNDFLFYYVDGVYFFSNKELEKEINQLILNKKYICKSKYISQFILVRTKSDRVKILIEKNSDKTDRKIFTIPQKKIKYILL